MPFRRFRALLTRGSPDQLMLMDDPAFLPDMALPALDFDFSNFILKPAGDSQRSSQSMLSIRNRSRSLSSHTGSGIGIQLPSSSTHAGAYHLPLDDPFGGSSAQKAFGGGRDAFGDDEENLYQDDMIFEFDADGMMRDIDVNEREARRAGSVFPPIQSRLESDSTASKRVRKDHENAAASQVLPFINDFDMVNYRDDEQMLPEAEPFPKIAGGSSRPKLMLAEKEFYQQPSSDSAEAPAKRRKPKQKTLLPQDNTIELRNADLIVWQKEYLTHMAVASVAHTQKKEASQAKKNAEAWVIGNGINGVGQGVGSSKLPSPLAMFSGAALFSKITGQPIPEAKTKGKRGTKRSSPDVEEEHSSPSNSKRVRQDDGIGFEDEVGRNFDDDLAIHDSSSGVEIGREAPSALADYPSSALMPWNVSASLHSHQRGSSVQVGRAGSVIVSSVGRHMRSASPLIGRGSNIPGELDHFSSQVDDMVMYGRSDNDIQSEVAGSKRGESGVSRSQAEFEIFGPAAQVDTQTAASSQWIKDALDRESGNFFEYVRNTISEKMGDELGEDDLDELVEGQKKFVTFEELFDPKQNSAMVAAQAFYHVLSLATKHRVWVEQDVDEEEIDPWCEIRIGVFG
jgi:meiotic recombination protein REC8